MKLIECVPNFSEGRDSSKIEHIINGKFHASLKKDFDEFLKLIIKEEIKNNAEKLNAVGSSKTPKLKNIFPLFVS